MAKKQVTEATASDEVVQAAAEPEETAEETAEQKRHREALEALERQRQEVLVKYKGKTEKEVPPLPGSVIFGGRKGEEPVVVDYRLDW